MSNYISRFTKTLFSFLPFGREDGDRIDCANCDRCRPSRATGKRKLEDDGNTIPEKKSSLVVPPLQATKVEVKNPENTENPSNSDVKLQIVKNLNELAKLMTSFAKEEGKNQNVANKAEDVKVQTENLILDKPVNGESSKVSLELSPGNASTSTRTEAVSKKDGEETVTSPAQPPDTSTATPTAKTEETLAASTDKKVEEGPDNSTTAPADPPKDDKTPAAAATTTAPVVDPQAEENAKAEEDSFINSHEVILSPPPGDSSSKNASELPPATSFSSPELAHHQLEKQIEFLQENVLTPFKFQEMFTSSGFVIPKGIYFYGPGVVSSALLLAKALATELGKELGKPVRLFRKLETDVCSKYGSEWKKFVTSLFTVAVKNKPAIVFIQDIDVVCNYCESDILTNKDMVNGLGVEIDKIIPGDVLVIFTIQDLKRSFPGLRTLPRFQKYMEFPQINSVSSIAANLKGNAAKWTKTSSKSEEAENDKILDQIAENIFKATPALNPEDVAQLCREVYQKSMQTQLKSLSTTKKPCSCICCVSNLSAGFPALKEWDDCLTGMVEIKKSSVPVDRYAWLKTTTTAPETEGVSPTLSFAQVGGLSKQIEILKENILVPLRNKEKLKELGWGVEPVRGFIFHGPPGTGKTLLGKALAAELSRLEEGRKFSFVYHKGTECHGMYVGQTEGKLREIFQNAATKKPAIIFLDEIDGLCEARTESGNSRFYNGVVTTILGLMDSVPRGEVFVIAATNRLSALDPALRRPGRFDKCVEFQAPKFDARKNILEIHTAAWKEESKLTPSLLEEIAEKTGGYTGADLEQLCRQAFVFAMRRHTTENTEVGTDGGMKGTGLDELCILEEDWHSALRVVKSSGSNCFGNAVISDKPTPKMALVALEGKLEAVTEKLSYFLKKEEVGGGEKSGTLNTFLIWGNGVKQQKVIDNLFIPSLISSKAFSSTVAAKIHLGMSCSEIAAAVQHVINPGEDKLGILYIPNVEHIFDTSIEGQCEVRAVHRQFLDNLEALRGERVLLLGTSGKKPASLPQEVQTLFRDVENTRRYEFKPPSVEELRRVFEDVAPKIAPSTHSQMIKMLTPLETGISSGTMTEKSVSVYDLLDFKAEVESVLKRFDGGDGTPKDGVDAELVKVIGAFGTYLAGDEKFQSSIRGMYT